MNTRLKLPEGKTITIEEAKQLLERYRTALSKTGEQLGWAYEQAAFPYTVHEREAVLYLQGDGRLYKGMAISVQTAGEETFIDVALPPGATNGDKGKANEFSKWLAKTLGGELHLFSGRTMTFGGL
ncbi:hypothetical protein GS3922_11165 [Geobacillus subterraneus]|uniref:DUF1885 domain-containing protein n=2 Tax=Geobacillus TaxID=129337 RepID=A0ABM6ACX7_9BACL|nr:MULTISPECIES: DUF1885 family protein [Geobacillus]AMX84175.1 hypothetical protein GS3922_11165 [Geobacillus subterraneus]KZS24510.1 hypothetical protein A5418_05680 [Geobacillus subterraneus]OXB88383.1 hypothetical protein B9L21_11055 [Geobacillus uzenensis]QIZ67189.1 DUF1885 family protein [Geobacillus subterraneus]WPZ19370.1 DUF1885 family protein [Geobacillus subterraneus]